MAAQKSAPSRTRRSDMRMVVTYGGRRVERLRKPVVNLDQELLNELLDTGSDHAVVWSIP